MDRRSCAECGGTNPADARFCNGCGSELGGEAAGSETDNVREERRQVTVLFSDVSGYTTMSEEIDPEILRELMNAVYDRAGEIIERYGGRVDKLMGDAVLAVFGDPVAHEDDATRAVRAAIDLHAAVEEISPEFEARAGRAIEMHSGINSGIVISSDHERDRESGPLGDMVNVAARLQSVASKGQIIVGAEAIALLGDSFALSDLGDLELKGRRDTVRAALVEGVADAAPPSRKASAFVGRNEEIGILLDGVDKVRDGTSSVIAVCAEAGAGKTRLFEELRQRLDDDVVWVEGRAYAYTTSIPYAPIVDLISRVAAIDEADNAAMVGQKLESLVERVVPGDDDALRVIRQLYGMASDSDDIDLEAFRSELSAALSRLIEATASGAPTVVCFQDLHWVDPSTADLIRDLVGRGGAPRVIIANFRPGFALGVDGARELMLSELSERQTREQLVSLLDGGEPPAGLLELVVERADGNPFFAEEIINSLVDRNGLELVGGSWVLADDVGVASIPSTVRALLEARIDGLDPGRKRVLREASVVGREFLYRLMASVASDPGDLDVSLDQLSAADLIRRTASDPDIEYIFKHALTQEVAYEGLLKRDRQSLHGRIARSIEEHLADRTGELVETLAFHYQRSGQVVEAVKYLRLAGNKALGQYSMTEAHQHFQSAYCLLTEDDPEASPIDPAVRDRLLLETLVDWCHAFYYTGEFKTLQELQSRHDELGERVGDAALDAVWRAWIGMAQWTGSAQVGLAAATLEDALERAVRADDVTARGYAMAWLSWVYWQSGQSTRAVELWDEVEDFIHRIPEAYDRRYITLKTMGGAAFAAASTGDVTTAAGMAKELRSIADSTGNRRAMALHHCVYATVHFLLGDEEEIRAHADAAVECGADPIYAMLANSWYVGAELAHGGVERAAVRFSEVGHLPRQSGNALMASQMDVFSAEIDILEGRLSRGTKRLDELRVSCERNADMWMTLMIDFFLGVMSTQIATKEAESSAFVAIRNPGFVRRYAIGAPKKARARLESLLVWSTENGYGAAGSMIEVQLAALAVADKRPDDARTHLESVLRALADFPESTYYRESAERLAELD